MGVGNKNGGAANSAFSIDPFDRHYDRFCKLPGPPFKRGNSLNAVRAISILSIVLFAAMPCGVGSIVCAAETAQPIVDPVVAKINDAIEQTWIDFEIRPAPVADDSVWCRRVHLDLIGRIPTVVELDRFLADDRDLRRENLVDRLLDDSEYKAEFASHWSTVWSNLLIGQTGGNENRSMVSREGMKKYLRDAFAHNKPYDQLVRELITATGSAKPGTGNFNGAVNFLIDKVNEEKGTLATSSVSRIFLGLQVQCTQCHDHPFNQWKQQKFWEFNSFFRQTRGLRRFKDGSNDVDFGELVDEDFAGEAFDPDNALVYYEKRNGRVEAAYPVFTDGTAIEHSGLVDVVNRREKLAELVLASEFLDKMIVNRTWAQFMGYGFTRPIDDLGPHNAPTHPELLEDLAGEFRNSSYDLKMLMRWIVLSQPYGLDSKLSADNEIDDPSVGETPKFSRFYLRQITAEQLYASMLGLGGNAMAGNDDQRDQMRQRWLEQFVTAFGNDEGTEATSFNGSIPQALMMFNGELTTAAISDASGSFLSTVAQRASTPVDQLNLLFRAGLARRPTKPEQRIAAKLYQSGGQKVMLQDMWWAVLNSNEFILQH